MSERPDPPPVSIPRPRRWQLALVLNVIFPPAGYAYVGAWRAAMVFAAALLVGAIVLTEWTVAFPPGMYRLGVPGVVVLALCLAVALGVHAAWMAEDAPAKTGSQLRHAVTYAAASVAVVTALQLFRAYWPHAFYSVASDSMAPTLQPGDIVLADGARARCGGRKLKPGQVVLYRRAGEAEPYIHRIVAAPGQTVSMALGRLRVDGRDVLWRLPPGRAPDSLAPAALVQETLADDPPYLISNMVSDRPTDDVAPLVVPVGSWYLVGDKRDNADDSRSHGPVAARDICAVAQKIITSRDKSHVGAKP